MTIIPSWATFDPFTASGENPHTLLNLVGGEWTSTEKTATLLDPMNGDEFIIYPRTEGKELTVFAKSLQKCPKSGLHNPLKNPEKYVMWGKVTRKLAEEMHKPEVVEFFIKTIQRVCPKHRGQALGEITVSRTFLENFSGDNVRFLARSFGNPGDRFGQQSQGYRWPHGPCALVSPFNFPLEIPVLQLMGALYMGNKVLMKCATTTAVVMEQFLHLMHFCGAPKDAVDFVNCGGRTMEHLLVEAKPALTQFTGSSGVAEQLIGTLKGRVKVEDAGFDFKILGPDVKDTGYVAWQCDQDAYALSGQKCSAQSCLFIHENWLKHGAVSGAKDVKDGKFGDLLKQMDAIKSERNVKDLSIGPLLSHTTEDVLGHAKALLDLPGAELLWGAKKLEDPLLAHVPAKYACVEPTAIMVPMDVFHENFALCTREIFGPFQVVVPFSDATLTRIFDASEKMTAHLTQAVVSDDPRFITTCLAHTINGTTYAGRRARTTGAPQNHHFGPAGAVAASIGTYEAIRYVWSYHREIVYDVVAPLEFHRPPPE
ncbi:Probable aldehyde dehydrogenase [Aduncisulcus paluster]|uniref:Probable aldehyde dehydrogenase n=1 Tax=Aduncisulcus paluster TaxID=2918883 RepID=A0ABQ5KD29_9EUKA|nr:Probable aldehyde dehydrogenase [Aduncisulcus paluster]GKT29836.1 Probable aldehyde dehydrogenase [Aduncisulcus paluster]|eukprot:gnl/Carplike_NY0171/795_a1091_1729.p1 GENE.gnl/Carplike_NY0171/795_a1091_1729~~gnl/Carplike_NY0171/795_a1091_1729.p1  ORF type:complete len:540 (-),score=179.46 gnl/Carplike_NY0171/795_a1091_1729:266-1885(-)